MSIEYTTKIVKGWLVDEDDFAESPKVYPDDFEELIDKGFLEWIDVYNDEYPCLLGITINRVNEGEVVNIKDYVEIDPKKEKELLEVAKEYFGITRPPKIMMACLVY